MSELKENEDIKTEEIEKNIQTELEQALEAYTKIEEENTELKNQLLRLAADIDNLRKRSAKQIDEAGKFAVNSFAKDLIEVLENLYLATQNIPAEILEESHPLYSLFKGVEITKNTLIKVFEKHGIKRISPEKGEAFDHNIHQAVSQIEHTEFVENAIIEVMRSGYILHDRLITPAIVVVAKAKL